MGIDEGHTVERVEHVHISGVSQVLHQLFDAIAELFHAMIGTCAEEEAEVVGRKPQTLRLAVVFGFLSNGLCQQQVCFLIGRSDDDLFAEEVSLGAEAQKSAEEGKISIEVEHHRVAVCHKGEIGSSRSEDEGRHPHAHHHVDATIARHLHARGVDDVVEDENTHRDNRGHAQSAFANDGTERCTHEEEEQASQRQGDTLVPFHLVLADVVFLIFHSLVAPCRFGGETLEHGGSAVARALHLLFGNFGNQAVKLQLHAREFTHRG